MKTQAELWDALNDIAESVIPTFHINDTDYVELRAAIAQRDTAREAIGWTETTNYVNPYKKKETP